MKKCLCDGKGWIRMPGTKAIIYCPDCEKSKIIKRKIIKAGTKIVSPIFGTGEVLEDAPKMIIKAKFSKLDTDTELDRSEVSYIYDQD
jgi:hypothetical protein